MPSSLAWCLAQQTILELIITQSSLLHFPSNPFDDWLVYFSQWQSNDISTFPTDWFHLTMHLIFPTANKLNCICTLWPRALGALEISAFSASVITTMTPHHDHHSEACGLNRGSSSSTPTESLERFAHDRFVTTGITRSDLKFNKLPLCRWAGGIAEGAKGSLEAGDQLWDHVIKQIRSINSLTFI